MGRAALNDKSKAKYRPVSNIVVPIQWTEHIWSDWYLETVNKLHNIENLAHMLSNTQKAYFLLGQYRQIFIKFPLDMIYSFNRQ